MTLVNSRPELMNLSFSGCGFLCVYHAGVAAAIKEYAPQLLQNKILGASAGSIIACGLITNVCLSNATSTILKVISQARLRTFGPLHPEFSLLGVVREELVKILPKNAYQLCTGRLIISLTRWSDHKNVMIDEYTSNDDLIDAIMCSCFIPLYCGLTPPKFRGVQYIDGGVSDNQPCYDEHTVTVSPFSGESDICPPDWDSGSLMGVDFNGTSIRFTARNMFRLMACLWPRSTEDCSKMCIQGFKDALRFLTKFGLSPCIRCLTIQTIDPCVSEVSDREDDSSNVTTRGGRCLTSPASTANLGIGRMRNRSSTSVMNLRARGESECEACCESDFIMEDINVDSVFPKIMQKPFEDAVAAEKSVFEYFLSFRIVRYATTALGIGKFPLDIALAFVKSVNNYLDLMSPPRWLIIKFRSLSDFILSEVEKQKSRYTKFSCLVAVTEVDRFGSALAHSTMEHNGEEKEIEMSEEAKNELRFLRERDRRRMRKDPREIPSTSSAAGPSPYDVDSFEHVVQFTKSHDLMYEFHYYDSNNEKRTCGLFAADNHRRHIHNHKNVLNKLEEEDVPAEDVRFIGGKNSGDEEEIDSGLSGVEVVNARNSVSSQPSTSTSKRDACCSPVREFSEPPPPVSENSPKVGRIRGNGRRYTNDVTMRTKPSTSMAKKKTSVVSSSDSEEVDGTEKLFVPSRKAWRASSDFDQKDPIVNNDTTA